MNFLFLVTEICNGTGGIRAFNNHLAKALLELGHSVRVVSMNDTKNHSLHYALSPMLYAQCLSGNYGHLRKPMFVTSTLRYAFSFRPDVILCGHINFSPLCMMLKKIFGISYFTITHGIEVWNLNGLKLPALKNSDKILSVSSFTKSKILSQMPDYPERSILILPDTFDSDKFRPGPKPKYLMDGWGIKEKDKVLLTIARLSKTEKYKGYDKVIEAMRDVVKEVPNVKYIVGGSGDDMERIQKIIEGNNLEERVVLTGFIPHEEVVDYYNLCDAYVMPSKGEGFGIVFLEALACGKPGIAGNKDASPEPLLDGELGILVDPDNRDEIKEAIIKLLRREVPERLLDGAYLRQRTIETYGYQKFKEKLEGILSARLKAKG